MKRAQTVHAPDLIGRSPVLWISEPFASGQRGFWAKLEGFNPGGMKDRPALHMVERAVARHGDGTGLSRV